MLWIAGASIAILLYTFVGYPALIGLLARIAPRPLRPRPGHRPTVTICIAAYNAEATLEAKLASLAAQDYPADRIEVLVYSDGSADRTQEIARSFAARDPRVRLIIGEERRGKPTGLNRMREEAKGEVLVIADSRQALSPNAVSALVAALSDPTVGIATGNLVLEGAAGSGVYWRYENWIRRQESRFRGVVGMTGPLAALRREDLGPVPADMILDDVWIPMNLPRARRRVVLVEEAQAFDRAFGDQREFGRKVRTLAGNYQLFARLPWLLVPFANRQWWETLSHKVLRLVCAWALLALAGATIAGLLAPAPGPERTLFPLVAAAQGAFYLGAALGGRAGRLGGVARTFVVMHTAALLGLWRFLTGGQRITW
jgi:cellulose synthase/poly-beta-1,6-N-acetylglucosamine synthase-like glycosyltransferase